MVDNELITKVRTRNVKSILSNVFGSSFTLSNGNGTTANVSAVDLGGDLTGDTLIGGAFTLELGTTGNELTALKGRATTVDLTGTQAGQTIALYLAANGYLRNGNYALEFDATQIRLTNTASHKLEFDATGAILNLGATNAAGDQYTRNAAGYLIRKGITSTASTATLTVNSDITYLAIVTAQAEAITIANPTGTPFTGQELSISLKDNGTSRAISFGNQYVEFETFPTATTLGKRMYLGFVYNGTGWDYMGSRTQL